jgi:hypothetical protein
MQRSVEDEGWRTQSKIDIFCYTEGEMTAVQVAMAIATQNGTNWKAEMSATVG